jgi:hypothetical protein
VSLIYNFGKSKILNKIIESLLDRLINTLDLTDFENLSGLYSLF